MIATMGVMLVLYFSDLAITFPDTAWGLVTVGIVIELWIKAFNKWI
jgi:hypothetical protein